MHPSSKTRISRASRLLGKISIGLVLVIATLFVAVLIALNMPAGRRFAAQRLNRVLTGQFKGKLRIDSFQGIDLLGLHDAHVRVFAPDGKQVLDLQGASVLVNLPKLAWGAIFGHAPLSLDIERLSLRNADVLVEQDASGAFTIARAFEPARPKPEQKPAKPGMKIGLGEVILDHAWIHGSLRALPVLDAEIAKFHGRLSLDDPSTDINVDRANVLARALPRGIDPSGELHAQVHLPKAPAAGLRAQGGFRGKVAGIPLDLHGTYADPRVDAEIVAPEVSGERVRALVPSLALKKSASVRIRVHGALPQLDGDALVKLGSASVQASAHVETRPQLSGSVSLAVRHLDAAAIVASAPFSDVSLDAHLRGKQGAAGSFDGSYTVASEPARVATYRVPALRLTGGFTEDSATARVESTENKLQAELALSVLPARATDLKSHPHDRLAEFSANIVVPRLEDLALDKQLSGSAQVHAKGRYDLGSGEVTAAGQVAASRVRLGANAIEGVTVAARVTGPARAPTLTAAAKLSDITTGTQHLAHLDVQAVGPLLSPGVQAQLDGPDGLRVNASATLAQGSLRVKDLNVAAIRDGARVEAEAREIHLDGPKISFDGVRVSGAGTFEASGAVNGSNLQVRALGHDLDLAALGRIAGLKRGLVQHGTLSIDADLRGSLDAMHGSLQTHVRDLSIAGFGASSADVNMKVTGRTLTGSLAANLAKAARLELDAKDLRLPPGRLNERSLLETSGELRLDSTFDLQQLTLAIPEDLRPFDHAEGTLTIGGTLKRTTPGELPDIELVAKTQRLLVVGKGSPAPINDRAQAKEREPSRIKDIDGDIQISLEGASGATALLANAHDNRGELLLANVHTHLSRSLLEARGPALQHLFANLPIEAEFAVPKRELAELPMSMRPAGLQGSVEGSLKARGTMSVPELELTAQARGLRSKDPTAPVPIDINASIAYRDDHTRLSIDAYRNGQPAMYARSDVDANLPRLIRTRGADPSLRASANVKLASFPLRTIPMLKERLVEGDLSGEVVLADVGQNAALTANARVDRLVLGNVHNQTASLDVRAKGNEFTSDVELKQPDGYLRAKVSSGINWGSRLVPELEDRSSTRTELTAKEFRIGSLQPFVAKQVSELDGRLDANLQSRSLGKDTAIEGQASLHDGTLQLPAIGQVFHGIRAKISAERGGVVKIEDVEARGREGRVRAAAAARLEGLTPRTARARLRIAKDEKLPLTTQGVELGDAWGALDVTMLTSQDRKTTTIDLNAPQFHLDLPETKQHKVQPLDDAENIHIGVRLDPKNFHTLPLQPLEEPKPNDGSRMIVNVVLGDDIWVRQGTTVRARIAGKLHIVMAGEMDLSGAIHIPQGTLDVSGKRFDIEHGIVTFEGSDPSNPTVIATARYDSPEGYRVYADFMGPVKSGKLKLHSEPALTEDEIFSLLMFGSTDGSFGSGTGEGSTAETAVGVAGGTATKGLNSALADLTDLDVSTRVDTSRGSPTPELVIQLSRRLAAQVGYNLGTPGLGQAPDRSFVTLDFRIRKRWSLDTTVGDHGGTTVDAVWRKRY